VTSNPPAPAGDARLATLATGFLARYETDAQKPYLAAVAALNQSYVSNGIARALATAQAKADLKEALALEAEKKAMEAGEGIPAEDTADTPPSLIILRATYRVALARIEDARAKSAAPLYDLYTSALDTYTIELTRASRLEEAMRVRALRDKISAEKSRGGPPSLVNASSAFTNALGMKFVPLPNTDILMCIHETRMKDYAAFARANPSRTGSSWQSPLLNGVAVQTGDDYPAVNILWDEAKAFCEWLGSTDGRTYRLATDHEWSAAVGIANREDKKTPPMELNGKITDDYPWGKTWPPPKGAGNLADTKFKEVFPSLSSLPDYADGFDTLAPVMSFEPNDLGIYDLAGNTWEWCEEWASDRRTQHIVRGGSWANAATSTLLLSSTRAGASVRAADRGFRVVVEAAR
jgi:hypothetical protein